MDLSFNSDAAFTKWIVQSGALHERFVVIDVGVQGGENPRWHLLGDCLILHGFDAIKEVVESLTRRNRDHPDRHYHWIAAGSVDEERPFYYNANDPCSSSFYRQGQDRFGFAETRVEQARKVAVRRLDTLLNEGIVQRPDFIKIDVEGFEEEVILGASETLGAVLGAETETNFGVSPGYPRGHLPTLHEHFFKHRLLVFDLAFNRIPRASFQRALVQNGLPPISNHWSVGKPATFNVLFARDAIDEIDHPENYSERSPPLNVDQLIKLMIICELHGLNDVALDTIVRFQDRVGSRLDSEKAMYLLANPHCRSPGRLPVSTSTDPSDNATLMEANAALEERIRHLEGSRSWRMTAPLRALRSGLTRRS